MADVMLMTSREPGAVGAVAIIAVYGSDAVSVLQKLTSRARWLPGVARLCDLGGVDEGLAVVMAGGGVVQLMPHGGPMVVRRLMARLCDLGCRVTPDPPGTAAYPEAASELEADVLSAIAGPASPAAIDVLAGQVEAWKAVVRGEGRSTRRFARKASLSVGVNRGELAERSGRWDRLLVPPRVVVVGRPSVGKSTLTNHLAGRGVSLVAEEAGTTRDWVGQVVELTVSDTVLAAGVAVRWIDTPGLRAVARGSVEARAVAIAMREIEAAEVVVAMRDPATPWPDEADLPDGRRPEVWVMNKVDAATQVEPGDGGSPETPLGISGQTGNGVDDLQAAVVKALGLGDVDAERPWAFSATLKNWTAGDVGDEALAAYVSGERGNGPLNPE